MPTLALRVVDPNHMILLSQLHPIDRDDDVAGRRAAVTQRVEQARTALAELFPGPVELRPLPPYDWEIHTAGQTDSSVLLGWIMIEFMTDDHAEFDGPCAYTLRTYTLLGRERFSASCSTCGAACTGWTQTAAVAAFEEHRAIPAPPADVLARTLTPADIRKFPEYFILGRGRSIALRTACAHGYRLTDSCPGCDDDRDQGR